MTTPTTTAPGYDIGASPVITITCKTVGDALTDPTTLIAEVQLAGAAKVTYTYGTSAELVKTSTGVFTLTVPAVTTAGRYQVYTLATGAVAAAQQGAFNVQAKNTTP